MLPSELVCFIFLSLFFLIFAQPPFPELPNQYSVYVAANIGNKNYTLAYREFYDEARQILRTEGRYINYDIVDVINFATGNWYRYNSTTCLRFTGVTENMQNQPSVAFFSLNGTGPKIYQGQQEIREITCNVYTQSFSFNDNTSVGIFSTLYYINPLTSLPVRVELQGSRAGNGTNNSYFHVYDWIDWQFNVATMDLAQLPTTCLTPIDTDYRFAIDRPDYYVSPAPAPGTRQIPLVPNKFSTLVENVQTDGVNPLVSTYSWYVDVSNETMYWERVDCHTSGFCPDNAKTVITQYFPTLSVNNAVQWTIDENTNKCTRNAYTLQKGVDLLSISPFRYIRTGTLPSIMTNLFLPRTFQGRTLQRGVPMSTFTASPTTIENLGIVYNYNHTMYFFPHGWGFPGRPDLYTNNPLLEIPGRVMNVGNWTVPGSNITTVLDDIWDFFLFVNAAPTDRDPQIFDATTFGCLMTDAPEFPTLPVQYSTYVSANFGEQNYTLAYREVYDGSTLRLYTQGRYQNYDTIDIIDFSKNLFYRFPQNGSSCVQYENVSLSNIFWQPSNIWFSFGNGTEKVYQGQIEQRETLCDYWTNTFNLTRNITTLFVFNATYYFTVDEPRVPVRVIVDGARIDTTGVNETFYYTHYYDWIDFTTADPNFEALISLPTVCNGVPLTPVPRAFTPSSFALDPVPTDWNAVHLPFIPKTFTTLVETKLTTVGNDDVRADYYWSVDVSDEDTQYERVDCLSPGTCPDDAIVMITIYTKVNSASVARNATQYIINSNRKCSRTVYPLSYSADTLALSPFATMRAGSIPLIMTNDFNPSAVYRGRSNQRGIPADGFGTETSHDNGDSFYTFNSTTYFFPGGWAFPGRPDNWLSATDVRLPARVINDGFVVEGTSVARYQDLWDFFFFVTDPPTKFDPNTFDTTIWDCPVTDTPKFPKFPPTYWTYVSANFENGNYTLTYKEWYDNATGILRTEGRYSDYNIVDVINFQKQTFYRYNYDTYECTEFLSLKSSPFWYPSISWFMQDTETPTYDRSDIVRGIPVQVFTSQQNMSQADGQGGTVFYVTDVIYYFRQDNALPVRAEISGSKYSNSSNGVVSSTTKYHHVYDWVLFTVSNTSNFSIPIDFLPDTCAKAPQLPSVSAYVIPNATLQPLPTDWNNVPMPIIPNQFITLIETKYFANPDWPTGQYSWIVNIPDNASVWYERLDCLRPGTCPDNAAFFVTIYNATGNGPITAAQYIVDGDTHRCKRTTTTLPRNSPKLALSPLTGVRAGSVPSIITNQFIDTTYSGRGDDNTLVRGIPADTFVAETTSINNGVAYSYRSDIYFYPEGWVFPGRRGQNENYRIPVQISNSGQYHDENGVPILYLDMWDFFLFIADEPEASLFDVETLWNCYTSDPPPFPQLPKQYSSYVSANFGNANYTLSYKESWDGDQQILKTEGRFESFDRVDIINFKEDTFYRYTQNYSAPCVQYENATQVRPITIQPSIYFFNITDAIPEFYGKAQVRFTDAYAFVRDFNFTSPETGQSSYFNATYYFDIQTGLPLRVDLIGTRFESTGETNHTFYHTYDWISFHVGPQPQIGRLPPTCLTAPVLPLNQSFIRPQTEVYPEPTPWNIVPTPQISPAFSTLVESKSLTPNGYSRAEFYWYIDHTDEAYQKERVDCLVPGTCPNNAATYITWYTPARTPGYPSTAMQWIVDNDGGCTRTTYNLNMTTSPPFSLSPFRLIRAGSIPRIFLNQFVELNYNGRSLQRGVPTDLFIGSALNINQDLPYYYNTSIYFFPDGWAFPGRPNTWLDFFNVHPPVRIINSGFYALNNDTVIPYSDEWDFFNFMESIPDESDTTLFDPTLFGCAMTTQKQTGLSKDMRIFVGVFVTFAGLVILICLYWQCCRGGKRGTTVAQTTKHIELKEMNTDEPEQEKDNEK